MTTISPNRTVVTTFAPTSTPSASTAYDEGHYVLHVANSKPVSKPLLICALSNHNVVTYDRETLKKVHTIQRCHTKAISDLNFSTTCMNTHDTMPMVVTSGRDGTVKIFDLRANASQNATDGTTQAAVEMKIPDHEALSVSIGYNGALAAVGGSKGNIHFFDLRNVSSQNGNGSGTIMKPLGTYVDSHTEEVTKVRFQHVVGSQGYETTSLLVSAAEDGLACIHDTSQPSEESALKSVLNIQSPLRDVGFFGPTLEGIYCLTGSETMSVWHHDTAQRIAEFGDIRNMLSSTSGIEINYLVGCHWDGSTLNLIAGNTQGECAMFQVDANSMSVKRVLSGGHKACIRTFALSSNEKSIITGGEDSRLCEWNLFNNVINGVNSDTSSRGSSLSSSNSVNSGAIKGSYSSSTQNTAPRQGGGRIRRQKVKRGHVPY